MGCVYLIRNKLDDKGYVGVSTTTAQERFKSHIKAASTKKRGKLGLADAIRKHGRDAFDVSTIEENDDLAYLLSREIYWIVKLKTRAPMGYNLTDGGRGPNGHKHTPEECRKISDSNRGQQRDDETRLRMSESQTGLARPNKHLTKKVQQFSVDGHLIATYNSVKEAAVMTGFTKGGIATVCRHERHTYMNFIWEYAEKIPRVFDTRLRKHVAQLTKQGTIVNEFHSVRQALLALNVELMQTNGFRVTRKEFDLAWRAGKPLRGYLWKVAETSKKTTQVT